MEYRLNNYFKILEMIGIKAYFENEKIYYKDIKTGNDFEIIDKSYGGEKIVDGMKPFQLVNMYYFTLSRPNKSIDLELRRNEEKDVIIKSISIKEPRIKYSVELFTDIVASRRTLYFKMYHYDTKITCCNMYDIDVKEDDSIFATDYVNGGSGDYKMYDSLRNHHLDKINEIIAKNKYFLLFLEYFSQYAPELMAIYNTFKAESQVISR